MADKPRDLPHLFPSNYGDKRKYKGKGGGSDKFPSKEKRDHGQRMRSRLRDAIESAQNEAEASLIGLEQTSTGLYLTFRAASGYDLPVESLENARGGIEVVHAQIVDGLSEITVFVPRGAEEFFDRKIKKYMTELTKGSKKYPEGRPCYESLIACIEDIQAAGLIRLWTDDPRHFPLHGQTIWWEVWVRDAAEEEFFAALEQLALSRGEHTLRFPDRLVIPVRGTPEDIDRLRYLTGAIAELRRQQETPHFFVEQLEAVEQRQWSDDLLGRVHPPSPDAPAVCILDTGVNRAHPLLANVLDAGDWHAWQPLGQPVWPKGDNRLDRAHGTAMAGLAAYGDLLTALDDNAPLRLGHRLESVRILPPGSRPNKPELYGVITMDAVGQAELAAPQRRRAFCLAVTADDCDGRPSSWSAAVDDLAVGKLDMAKRLFVMSAGNVREAIEPCDDYLYRCQRTPSADPTQAWNGLVVGACTFLQTINDQTFAGWEPLASPGDLSPYSATSCEWDPKWALRPDVVIEGGNLAVSPSGAEWRSPACLALLTTHHDIPNRFFGTIHATSAAAAQVSWMAAETLAHLPDCWEETVRALIVHSAVWPPLVADKFNAVQKSERASLLRTYGFGVPDIRRVLASAGNDVAVVVENEMMVVAAGGTMPEMHFYQLPWTGDLLRDLGDTPVKLRVTLSYFVESNPAARGWKGRYRYASHGFRFHLQRPNEPDQAFFARVSHIKDGDDDWDGVEGGNDGWFLGTNQRNRGSLHSDIWEGFAIDLADRRKLAIVPLGGWWKSRRSPEKRARYSLVVSLATPTDQVDLYTPVSTELATLTTLPTVIET